MSCAQPDVALNQKIKAAFLVLGIPPGPVTKDQIKKAFKTKAFEVHPDRNPSDLNAAEKFKEAFHAHALLMSLLSDDAQHTKSQRESTTSPIDYAEYLMEILVEGKKWERMISIVFQSLSLKKKVMYHLEENLEEIINAGEVFVLEFIAENTESKKVFDSILCSFLRTGDINGIMKMLDNALSRDKTEWVLSHAVKLFDEEPEIRHHLLSVLENNVSMILEQRQVQAMALLLKNSRNVSIHKRIIDDLINSGDLLTLRYLIEEKEREKEWMWIATTAMEMPEEMRNHCMSVLERNLEAVMDDGRSGLLSFLGKNTSSEETRMKIIGSLIESESLDVVKAILDEMAEGKKWEAMIKCSDALFDAQPELRMHAVSLMEKDIEGVIGQGQNDVLAFVWNNAGADETRHIMMGMLVYGGKTQEARALLDSIAEQGQWRFIEHFESTLLNGREELRKYCRALMGKAGVETGLQHCTLPASAEKSYQAVLMACIIFFHNVKDSFVGIFK